MSNVDANRQRAFAEVVSIDAWHEQSSSRTAKVALHADVVFGIGRLGGEPTSQVRFRLSIKRAELVMIGPGEEPWGVDKASVERAGDGMKMTRTVEKTSKAEGSLGGGVDLTASPNNVLGRANLSAKGKVERNLTETLKGSEKLASIKVTCRFQNADKRYHWALEPTHERVLNGRPWNPVDTPLLILVDQRKDRSKGLAPSVRLEIICLREDLEITDIDLKKNDGGSGLLSRIGGKNRMIAAEAYIRNQLTEAGIEVADLRDKFAKITLADVFANDGKIG